MKSHLSSHAHAKLGLSWERFLLGLHHWMSISLGCCLKYTPCNVEETELKTYFGFNSVWPRDRLSDQ